MAIKFPGEITPPARGTPPSTRIVSQLSMTAIITDINGQKRFLINDGSNDRILIGYQSGGF